MKFSLIAGLVLLCQVTIAALSSSELVGLSKSDKYGIIHVNDNNYEQILQGAKDHHLIMLMTSTSSQINCVLCNEFKPEYELVTLSWAQDHPQGLSEQDIESGLQAIERGDRKASQPPKNIFFLYAEFTDSRELFSLFQLNNIPKVFYIPPSKNTNPRAFLLESKEYQFFAGSHKDLLIGWIEELTGEHLEIHIPPDYTKVITNVVGVIGFLILGKIFSKQIGQVLLSKIIWSALSLVFILLLTSGYMFNQIRGSPYVKELGNGRLEYFMQGQQNQYGVETQIMSFVYGLLSLFTIILVKKAPEVKNVQVRLLTVIIFSGLIFFFYSLLVSIFGIKGMGYPYRLMRII